MPPLPMRFLLSAPGAGDLPDSRVEVAVVGRSNVGKSSLVNALSGQNGLALVSKTPGRTRLLNCFAVTGDATLVDCPGYGYAEASKSMNPTTAVSPRAAAAIRCIARSFAARKPASSTRSPMQ